MKDIIPMAKLLMAVQSKTSIAWRPNRFLFSDSMIDTLALFKCIYLLGSLVFLLSTFFLTLHISIYQDEKRNTLIYIYDLFIYF